MVLELRQLQGGFNQAPTDTSPAFERSFHHLSEQLRLAVGHRLFTVSRILPGALETERIYTTNPQVFPIQGRKPMDTSDWTAQMDRGECFVANHPRDFGAHFGDLDTIMSIGLGSVINIPIHDPVNDGGRRLGTLNLLDAPGAYEGEVLVACLAARPLALRAFHEYEQFLETRST
jgi:hypothetical protein